MPREVRRAVDLQTWSSAEHVNHGRARAGEAARAYTRSAPSSPGVRKHSSAPAATAAAADAPVSAAAIPRRRKRSRTPMPPSSLTPSAIALWKAAPAGSPCTRARCPRPA